MIEYALILALLVAACFGIVATLGGSVSTALHSVSQDFKGPSAPAALTPPTTAGTATGTGDVTTPVAGIHAGDLLVTVETARCPGSDCTDNASVGDNWGDAWYADDTNFIPSPPYDTEDSIWSLSVTGSAPLWVGTTGQSPDAVETLTVLDFGTQAHAPAQNDSQAFALGASHLAVGSFNPDGSRYLAVGVLATADASTTATATGPLGGVEHSAGQWVVAGSSTSTADAESWTTSTPDDLVGAVVVYPLGAPSPPVHSFQPGSVQVAAGNGDRSLATNFSMRDGDLLVAVETAQCPADDCALAAGVIDSQGDHWSRDLATVTPSGDAEQTVWSWQATGLNPTSPITIETSGQVADASETFTLIDFPVSATRSGGTARARAEAATACTGLDTTTGCTMTLSGLAGETVDVAIFSGATAATASADLQSSATPGFGGVLTSGPGAYLQWVDVDDVTAPSLTTAWTSFGPDDVLGGLVAYAVG